MIYQLLSLSSIRQVHRKICRIPLRYLASSFAAGSEKPKAVVFDMGGVVIPSPVAHFQTFEEKYGLPKGSIVAAIIAGGEEGRQVKILFALFLISNNVIGTAVRSLTSAERSRFDPQLWKDLNLCQLFDLLFCQS